MQSPAALWSSIGARSNYQVSSIAISLESIVEVGSRSIVGVTVGSSRSSSNWLVMGMKGQIASIYADLEARVNGLPTVGLSACR